MVLSDTQLIPISQNGVQDENFVENAGENEIDSLENNGYNEDDNITDGSHLRNGKLKSNIKYKSGEYEYIYSTDDLGRITKAQTNELQFTEREKRLKHNSNTLGKEEGDHAGHLFGDRFGGSEDIDNLVSQLALVNMSKYKKIENQWARAIKNGQKVSVDIEVKYDGDSMRPVGFIVKYTIDGISFKKNITN
ncbi:MAG: DNA/RNA non-specific endonuclease [Clostridia bacterium]|nr:DNA/RNA non-specific endonuclease [Clostridia bacterium]